MSAALGVAWVGARLERTTRRTKLVALAAGAALLGMSCVVNLALGVLDQQVTSADVSGTSSMVGFESFRHHLHHDLLGGAEPDVTVGSAVPTRPRVGALAMDRSCSSMAVWTGQRWEVIERGRGGGAGVLVGPLPSGSGTVPLAFGRRNPTTVVALGLEVRDGRAAVVVARRRAGTSWRIARGGAFAFGSGPHRFAVTLSARQFESLGSTSVVVDGHTRFVDRSFGAGGTDVRFGVAPPDAPPGWRRASGLELLPTSTTAPLCSWLVHLR